MMSILIKPEDEALGDSLSSEVNSALPLQFRQGINKVTERLRRYNEIGPILVAIGPFHHGRERLKPMEELKRWYLRLLCHRQGNRLTSFVSLMRREELRFRDCYEEKLDLSSDEFVQMMLVDGCFIIELLRENMRVLCSSSPASPDDDVIFNTPRMLETLKNDLLLVENQLPWIVVDYLFELTKEPESMSPLHALIRLFLQNPTFQQPLGTPMPQVDEWGTTHLLEVARKFVVEPYPVDMQHIEYRTPIPSVTELQEIGVKFVPASSKQTQLDITFRNGVMEIPPITIRESGESFIRNLIAYEQYSPKPEECQMTSYALLLSQLIKSVQDVDLLTAKGIIITRELSKVSTASLFDRLSNGTEALFFIYCDLAKEVNEYCKRRWLRSWLVRIKGDYLYNPSSFWSVSNGVAVILLLTFTQTIYTVLSYYKSK